MSFPHRALLACLALGAALAGLGLATLDPGGAPSVAQPAASPAPIAAAVSGVLNGPRATAAPSRTGIPQPGPTAIAGEVVDTEGNPVYGARVSAASDEGSDLEVQDAPARWDDLAPGRWTLRAEADDHLPGAAEVELSGGARTVLIELRAGVRIRGNVTNRFGTPLHGRTVWFLPAGADHPLADDDAVGLPFAKTDRLGRFTSPLLEPGPRRLSIGRVGRIQLAMEAARAIEGTSHEVDVVFPGGSLLEVVVDGLSADDTRSSRLFVLESDGPPAPDEEERWRRAEVEDVPEGGELTFESLFPGSYRIALRTGGERFASVASFTLDNERVTSVRVPAPAPSGRREMSREERRAARAEQRHPALPIEIDYVPLDPSLPGPGFHWN